MRKTHLWSGAAVLAVAGLLSASPALAATHHRHHGMSTPAEREKTKQLNLQQLAMAQGQAPTNMTASVAAPNATPEVSTPATNQPMAQPSTEQPAPSDQANPPASTPSVQPAPVTTPSNGQ